MSGVIAPPALAVLTTWDGALRVAPAGVFYPNDGRKISSGCWRIDAASAARAIAASLGGKDIVIDYEHQTLASEKNGQPAPAAGWISQLEWREGEGLFATEVKWTEKAKASIQAGEYRYVSPVFAYHPSTGEVLKIHSMALTNSPALSGLIDLGALAVNSAGRQDGGGAVRDTEKSIETFNAVFGPGGNYHPDTPLGALAALRQEPAKSTLGPDLTEAQADYMKRCFPDVFTG